MAKPKKKAATPTLREDIGNTFRLGMAMLAGVGVKSCHEHLGAAENNPYVRECVKQKQADAAARGATATIGEIGASYGTADEHGWNQ